jgi:hypothetical protein
MSQEKPSASEQTPPEPSPQELALRAAVAHRVLAFWKAFCQPVIDANNEYIETHPGIPSTVAQIEGIRAATFTESIRKAFFEITDADAFLEWADEQGETEWVVRKAFQEAILKKRARWDKKAGVAIDSQTGEVIPGVTQNPGGDFISVKPTFTDAGREHIDDVLSDLFGQTTTALPMLGPGTSDETAEGAA